MFSNLTIYKFTELFDLTANELEEAIEGNRFVPCGKHEEFSLGWTPPIGETLVHACNGFMMLCLKREEKVLPASVVNEMLSDEIAKIESRDGCASTRKQKSSLKDELIFELLPRAFSHSKNTHAYIDPVGGWIIVDAASAAKAEELLSYLRKCLGSLAVTPINTTNNPVGVMTEWLISGVVPQGFVINDECELQSMEDTKTIVRCKHHNLSLPEITHHLETGKQVVKLAMTWSDRLSFVLDENLAIKRLKFLDIIQDQMADIEAEDEAARFDADFSIMSLEIARFLLLLVEVFGGEDL